MELEKELTLRDLYYNPSVGYKSGEQLFQLAKQHGLDVNRNEIRRFLQRQKTYTTLKKFTTPKHFRKTHVRDLAEQVQVDLVVLSARDYVRDNDGYKYIFMAIEILSQYAFATALKKRDGPSVKKVMEDFLEDFHDKYHKYPDLMQFDEGSEFLNKDVKPLLKSKDIEYFTTHSPRKASIVERLNRTIQMKLRKIFQVQGDKEWVSHLADVVENYNTTTHRSIGMAPNDVNELNKFTVWGRLYGKVVSVEKPKFSVGDKVRVLHFSDVGRGKSFQKKFREKYPPKKSQHLITEKDKPPFTEETFQVSKVLLDDPVVYELYAPDLDDTVLGKFYESELSLVRE